MNVQEKYLFDLQGFIFKYNPFPISWSARYYNADQYAVLTERQIAILEALYARYNGRKTHTSKAS